MSVELKVPQVGESITEVVIGRWLVQPGQQVAKDDPVVEIETDKVTLELPAPTSGTVREQVKAQGEQARVGDVIGHMEPGEAPAADAKAVDTKAAHSPAPAASSNAASATVAHAPQASAPATSKAVTIMPAAQRLLDEHKLAADQVPASGPGGRLLKEDVQRYLEQRDSAPSTPSDRGLEREEQVVPMSPLRKRIATNLVQAQQQAALLTTFNEIDMTQVMDLRSRYKDAFEKRYQIKLGFMSFFIKAVIDGLKQYPGLNAEIRQESVVYKNHYDIGIAVGSGKGLVVPVIRDADLLSFAQLEQAIADFAARIKANKIRLEELTGGTFTITNGGVYGSLLSTPIINPPQSGVLGMHTIQQRPMAVDGQVVIRPMMYVALTYDHRIVDGREAVSFLVRLKQTLEDPNRMLMEV